MVNVPAVIVRRATRIESISRRRQGLSAEEQRTYRRLPLARRPDWLAARTAAKEAYRHSTSLARIVPAAIEVRHARGGAPRLRGQNTHVSIAHSEGWGAAAIAPLPVGIDLEYVRPHGARVLEHVAGPDEVTYLEEMATDDAELFCLAWAVKEAVLKGMTVGLRAPMRSVRIVSRFGRRLHVTAPATLSGPHEWLVATRLVEGFAAALALPKDGHVRLRCSWYLPTRL